MKNVILLIVLSMVACDVNAQLPWELPAKPGAWDYPVKPGMEEWKQFRSSEEAARANQIPEEVLSSLSTEDLTDLCLRYPLIEDILIFENRNTYLDQLFSNFNGIRELYLRKDISGSITKRYMEKIQSLSFLDDDTNSDLEKGGFIVAISVLEALLSRIERKNDEEKDNLKEVLRCLVAGYEAKLKYVDYFKVFGFQTNFYSRAHIIAKMDRSFVERLPNKEKNAALHSGRVRDEHTVYVIDELSYQLIK